MDKETLRKVYVAHLETIEEYLQAICYLNDLKTNEFNRGELDKISITYYDKAIYGLQTVCEKCIADLKEDIYME